MPILRSSIALGLLVAVLAAGCGDGPPSPESVVRAWSQALNAGDNETAANLFAPNAEIVQAGTAFHLATHQSAVAWNASLPCSGQIVSIRTDGETATAIFLLGDRKTSNCNGPGAKATAAVTVRKGKIVLWHQLEAPPPQPGVVV